MSRTTTPRALKTTDIVTPLLAWMAGAARDLPWRRRRDPYAVWVSEIMLQQTQVATVTPYFERWMARFPTIEALARAPLDDVLKAWEGLGYYARARNLQRAAQVVVEKHGGVVPETRDALLALPGIGRYTAGAILSLAYGRREPVLDGNVRRVLCRLYDIAEDPRLPEQEARLWELSAELVRAAPDGRVADLNESLIELGALVCTPAAPQCDPCPVSGECLALRRGTVAQRPLAVPRAPTPHHHTVAAVVQDAEGRYLIVQRQLTGLLGGLWGFPGGTMVDAETVEDGVRRTVREQTGVEVEAQDLLRPIKHAYTHFHITLHPVRCRLLGGDTRPTACADARWVALGELEQFAFPVTDRKVYRQVAVRG